MNKKRFIKYERIDGEVQLYQIEIEFVEFVVNKNNNFVRPRKKRIK